MKEWKKGLYKEILKKRSNNVTEKYGQTERKKRDKKNTDMKKNKK